MKTFEVNLSVEGIDKLVKGMNGIEEAIMRGAEKAINYLTDYGVRYAQDIVEQSVGMTGYYTSTGTLKNSIVNEQAIRDMTGTIVGRIYTNLEYAKFVEFGTGIIGERYSHPKAGEQGWNYNVGQTPKAHGKNGNLEGWWYLGADGKRHYTSGQVAVQYMWKTQQELERIAQKITKEFIEKELRGI